MAHWIDSFEVKKNSKELTNRVHEAVIIAVISSLISILFIGYLNYYVKYSLFFFVTLIFLSSIIYPLVLHLKPKGKIDVSNKAVVISGCDSGFGFSIAQRLDELGFQVFAGCLYPDGDGAKKLKMAASGRLHIIKLDVTKDDDIKKCVAYVNNNLENNKLWAVLCNAGICDGGEISWTDMSFIKRMFDVNTFGVIRLTKAFLPNLCETKGRVVVVTSFFGRKVIYGTVPYCMTKSASILFCEGLQLEIGYRCGIKVIAVEPWLYRTNITNSNNIGSNMSIAWNLAPQSVKKYYPDNYLQQVSKTCCKSIDLLNNNRPQEVVSCMEEAIVAENPKYVYTPKSLLFRFILWSVNQVPQPIYDSFQIAFLSHYDTKCY